MKKYTHRFRALLLTIVCSAASVVAVGDAQEEANVDLVKRFYAALDAADANGDMAQQITGIAETFLSPEYAQHNKHLADLPGDGTHRDKLIRMFQSMPPKPAGAPAPVAPKMLSIMGDGDSVMLLTSREVLNPESGEMETVFIFNAFRVENQQLVEHWTASSK